MYRKQAKERECNGHRKLHGVVAESIRKESTTRTVLGQKACGCRESRDVKGVSIIKGVGKREWM